MTKRQILIAAAIFSLMLMSTLVIAENGQQFSEKERLVDAELMSYSGDVTSNEFSIMCHEKERTLVAGKVYMADTNKSVKFADVAVTCYRDNQTNMIQTKSGLFGKYAVIFKESECDENDEVIVEAWYKDLYGKEEGTIVQGKGIFKKFDVAFVDVPLVPEYTLIAGLLTIAGALIVFSIVRKK